MHFRYFASREFDVSGSWQASFRVVGGVREEGTIQTISMTFARRPGPESGLDCLVCAEFTRQRTAADQNHNGGDDDDNDTNDNNDNNNNRHPTMAQIPIGRKPKASTLRWQGRSGENDFE